MINHDKCKAWEEALSIEKEKVKKLEEELRMLEECYKSTMKLVASFKKELDEQE